MPLFGEKAVTFLADYHEAVVEQIMQRYQEQKHAMANFQSQRSNHDEKDDTTEDVHTRLFLRYAIFFTIDPIKAIVAQLRKRLLEKCTKASSDFIQCFSTVKLNLKFTI